MIQVTAIEVRGVSEVGHFAGRVQLKPGLNVFSQENAYGKTLAITAIPWCLGLEAMFGLRNNDPSRFPPAVRDVITLGSRKSVPVVSSEALVSFRRDDGSAITLRRAIKGGDLEVVTVTEQVAGAERKSNLQARRGTMVDEVGGLQRFLYEWMGLPRTPLMTFKGTVAEIYLENVTPLFYVDQDEGWTDLQALQVYTYQIQEIAESAVEYMLGARNALRHRFEHQQHVSTEARLKAEADKLSLRIEEFFRAQGWAFKPSTQGSSASIAKRWAAQKLSDVASKEFSMNPVAETRRTEERLSKLKDALSKSGAVDVQMAPASRASQEVVELKTRRHKLRDALRDASTQLSEQRTLLETIEHRAHSSSDVLRLKMQGIGRLDRVECPTCHRHLDPNTFELSVQSTEVVQAHIDALKKQRTLILANVSSLEKEVIALEHGLRDADERLLLAERALESVNAVVGNARERIAKIAGDLASGERDLERLRNYVRQIAEFEREVAQWIEEAKGSSQNEGGEGDLHERIATFEQELGRQLVALGHSALVPKSKARDIRLDERYVPFLDGRRVRSLGSASDHARLVAAYVLGLGDASRKMGGPHPGFLVLDEPLQQNPDDKHIELMLKFFEENAADKSKQVIVTTYLKPDKLARIRKAGVNAVKLPGTNFLAPVEKSED